MECQSCHTFGLSIMPYENNTLDMLSLEKVILRGPLWCHLMDPKLADTIWSQTVRDHFLSAIWWPKNRPHFWAPRGIPIVAQESVHGPVVFWASIHPLSGLPEPTDNTHRQCVLSVLLGKPDTGWNRGQKKRFMGGFLGNNWNAFWSPKVGSLFGPQNRGQKMVTDRL